MIDIILRIFFFIFHLINVKRYLKGYRLNCLLGCLCCELLHEADAKRHGEEYDTVDRNV